MADGGPTRSGSPLQVPFIENPQTLSKLSFADLLKNNGGVPSNFNNSVGIPSTIVGLKPILTHQGKPAICFKDSEKKGLIEKLNHVLIAKWSHGRPSMVTIRNFFLTLHLKGDFNLAFYDSKHMIIECVMFEDFVNIWLKGVWVINGFQLRIFKWSEEFNPSFESALSPVWIHLPRLPLFLYDEASLLSIANAIGRPLKIDPCNIYRSKLGCASICVEVDVSSARVDDIFICFTKDSSASLLRGFWQKVIYGAMPPFCQACKHLGHSVASCKRTSTSSIEVFQKEECMENKFNVKIAHVSSLPVPVHTAFSSINLGLSGLGSIETDGSEFVRNGVGELGATNKDLKQLEGMFANKVPLSGWNTTSSKTSVKTYVDNQKQIQSKVFQVKTQTPADAVGLHVNAHNISVNVVAAAITPEVLSARNVGTAKNSATSPQEAEKECAALEHGAISQIAATTQAVQGLAVTAQVFQGKQDSFLAGEEQVGELTRTNVGETAVLIEDTQKSEDACSSGTCVPQAQALHNVIEIEDITFEDDHSNTEVYGWDKGIKQVENQIKQIDVQLQKKVIDVLPNGSSRNFDSKPVLEQREAEDFSEQVESNDTGIKQVAGMLLHTANHGHEDQDHIQVQGKHSWADLVAEEQVPGVASEPSNADAAYPAAGSYVVYPAALDMGYDNRWPMEQTNKNHSSAVSIKDEQKSHAKEHAVLVENQANFVAEEGKKEETSIISQLSPSEVKACAKKELQKVFSSSTSALPSTPNPLILDKVGNAVPLSEIIEKSARVSELSKELSEFRNSDEDLKGENGIDILRASGNYDKLVTWYTIQILRTLEDHRQTTFYKEMATDEGTPWNQEVINNGSTLDDKQWTTDKRKVYTTEKATTVSQEVIPDGAAEDKKEWTTVKRRSQRLNKKQGK